MLESMALFLDIDGTLLTFADTPREVRVDKPLVALLSELSRRTTGALAFVSGRSVASIDSLFHPLRLPAAGLHGFERRGADGQLRRHPYPPAAKLATARVAMRALAAFDPGLQLEDKGLLLALHYRRAPRLGVHVLEAMEQIAMEAGPELVLQPGNCVVELHPRGVSKGAAIDEFMQEAPFRGRRPVYVGDDLTDESGFESVNRAGGRSILVGERQPTVARDRLPDTGAVRSWLQSIL